MLAPNREDPPMIEPTRRNSTRRASIILAFLTMGLASISSGQVQAETIFGLTTDSRLLRFDSASPGTIQTTSSITGLVGGDSLVGIDFRPATGQLFGLGSLSRLYTINTATGLATVVGSAGAFTLSGSAF